jgi:ATP-dependent DNA helicase RecG
VQFAHLALVVTDEQHRFGVNQRAALVNKSGYAPDTLIMTATPIPRTLALTVYGDVDLSIMRGMPPGRKQVQTLCYTGEMRDKIYAGLVRQVRAGRQAYVVCPLSKRWKAATWPASTMCSCI